MKPEDRRRLDALGLPADVVARTEEVLRHWGVDDLFAVCVDCHEPCLHPDLPRGKHLRKKLPADLFRDRDKVGFRDRQGNVVCWACDEVRFH